MPIIDLRDVSKNFPEPGSSGEVAVLRNVSLEIDPGQSVAITGPSGSGKSTLLNLIGGLDHPSSGSITVDGKNVSGLGAKDAAGFRARTVGFIFQHHHLLPQATALENVLLPHLAKDALPLEETPEDRARSLLKRVGLGERLTHRPAALSGGERLRCAVARALMNKPAVLLADEPTGSLDPEKATDIIDLLLEINAQENLTLLVVTHDRGIAERLQQHFSLQQGELQPATDAKKS